VYHATGRSPRVHVRYSGIHGKFKNTDGTHTTEHQTVGSGYSISGYMKKD
jgi:hypothetical protein